MLSPSHSTIQAFIDYIKFEKRYSAHTIRSYADDLQQFVDFLIVQMGYKDFSPETVRNVEVRNWVVDLRRQGMQVKTLHRKISTLKSYFKFLLRQGLIAQTPMTGVTMPKIPRRLPVFVKEQSMPQVLAAGEGEDDFGAYTAQLLVEVLYATGMRSAELQQLKETQVDFGNRLIRVYGKGGKERLIPMGGELEQRLKAYLAAKTGLDREVNRERFFVKTNGKPLTQKDVYHAARNALGKTVGLEKKSPHVLRHTFATHLLNQGADLNAVKELLGHSSLAATQVYTHNTIEKLKEVHKKAHPKG